MDKKYYKDIYFKYLVLLIIIATALRLYCIGVNSLWLDEVSTYGFSKDGFIAAFDYSLGGEYNPPLYYWFTYISLVICSLFSGLQQEVVLRLPAALFGILSVPAIYYLAHEMFDKRVAIISATFMTFSGFLIYYSQEARVYTLSMFLYIILLYYYVKSYKTGSVKNWAIMGIVASLCIWSHFYMAIGLLCIAIHYIVMCAIDKKIDKNSLIPALVFLITSAPVFLILNNLFVERVSKDITWGFDGLTLLVNFVYLNLGMDLVTMLIFFVVGIVGLKCINDKCSKFNLLLIIIPVFITFILSYYMSDVIDLNPRYLLFILPLIAICIAAFDLSLRDKKHGESLYVIFIVILIVVNIPFLTSYYTYPTKTDYNQISDYIVGVDTANIILMPQSEGKVFDYYLGSNHNYANNLTELKNKANGDALVMVTSGIIFGSNSGNVDVYTWLNDNAKLDKEIMNVKFYIFDNKDYIS